ncbi:MAG: acetyl-CoA carboxylase carboxyl transferase subunit alpha, partial [Sulfitobacter sp.]
IGVPLISVIVGEGGSGGAVAFATANRVAMLEHSVYSVITPEGCASILWKDSEKMREAAEQMRLTANELKTLGVIDQIIPEPMGGAHRHAEESIKAVGKSIEAMLKELDGKDGKTLVKERRTKFLEMGRKGLAA